MNEYAKALEYWREAMGTGFEEGEICPIGKVPSPHIFAVAHALTLLADLSWVEEMKPRDPYLGTLDYGVGYVAALEAVKQKLEG